MHTPHESRPSDAAAADLQCRELIELITDYLEGALPATTRAQFDAHLRTCSVCCAYVSDMVVLIERTGSLRDAWPTAHDRERLLALFHNWRERP